MTDGNTVGQGYRRVSSLFMLQQTDRWHLVFGVYWQRDGGDWGSEGKAARLLLGIFVSASPDFSMSNIFEGIHPTEPTVCNTERAKECMLSSATVTHTTLLQGCLLSHTCLAYECVSEWESGMSKERDYSQDGEKSVDDVKCKPWSTWRGASCFVSWGVSSN